MTGGHSKRCSVMLRARRTCRNVMLVAITGGGGATVEPPPAGNFKLPNTKFSAMTLTRTTSFKQQLLKLAQDPWEQQEIRIRVMTLHRSQKQVPLDLHVSQFIIFTPKSAEIHRDGQLYSTRKVLLHATY